MLEQDKKYIRRGGKSRRGNKEGEERVGEQGGRGIAKITMVVTMMKTMIMAVMMMIATKRMMILTMKTKMLRMVK